jgi:hypothetical protein
VRWRGILSLLVGACASTPAVAQDAWVFASAIPCATAPVYGLPFNQCWVSNTRGFRIGNIRAWRLLFADSKSEVAVGLYKLVEPHGADGMSPAAGSAVIDWLRTADALKNVTAGASGWALSGGQYVTFQKPGRQCIGFVRNGPAVSGRIDWLLGATVCRESPTPIPPSEAQFLSDAVRVRD